MRGGGIPRPRGRLGRVSARPARAGTSSSPRTTGSTRAAGACFVLDEEGAGSGRSSRSPSPAGPGATPAVVRLGRSGRPATGRGSSAFAVGRLRREEPVPPARAAEPRPRARPARRSPWRAPSASSGSASGRSGRYDAGRREGDARLGRGRCRGRSRARPDPGRRRPGRPDAAVHRAGRAWPSGASTPQSGAVRWRTVLGAPGRSRPTLRPATDALTTLGLDGRALAIPRGTTRLGRLRRSILPPPGGFRLPPGRLDATRRRRAHGARAGPGLGPLLVRAGSGPFRRVDLPAPLAAAPLLWGREVLVPGADGRALPDRPGDRRVARPSRSCPPFDRDRPTRWKAPVRLEGDAVVAGRRAGTGPPADPRPGAEAQAGRLGRGEPRQGGDRRPGIDRGTRSCWRRPTAASGRSRRRDLSPLGAWPLEPPLASPPVAVSGRCFVADKARGVLALGPEGQRLWSATLRDASAGPPVVQDQAVWFLGARRVARTPEPGRRRPARPGRAGNPPGRRPEPVGHDLVVPVALGTVRRFDTGAAASGAEK